MTAPHEIDIKRALPTWGVPAQDEAAADLDRILGEDALFRLDEACKRLRISMPSIYRGMRAGRIPYVWIGSRRAITRPVMKRLMRNGVGPFSGSKKPTAAAD
jgi:excisionase family DNA binding protein